MTPFKLVALSTSFLVVVGCGSNSGSTGSSGGSSGSSSPDDAGSPDGGGTDSSVGGQGSSGGSSGGTVGGTGAQGLSWDDNGTAHKAYSAEAILGTSSNPNINLDTLEIVAVELSGGGLGMSISGPPPLDGTYTCVIAGSAFVEFTYELMADVQTCSVTMTVTTDADGGQRAAGTFSATATPADAGIRQLTNGQFNLPVMIEK